MAYHLSVVEIIHEINQQDTPTSPKPHTSEMSITRQGFVRAKFSRGHIMSVNEQSIYDAALARWGHDRQMLKTIDACGQLRLSQKGHLQ